MTLMICLVQFNTQQLLMKRQHDLQKVLVDQFMASNNINGDVQDSSSQQHRAVIPSVRNDNDDDIAPFTAVTLTADLSSRETASSSSSSGCNTNQATIANVADQQQGSDQTNASDDDDGNVVLYTGSLPNRRRLQQISSRPSTSHNCFVGHNVPPEHQVLAELSQQAPALALSASCNAIGLRSQDRPQEIVGFQIKRPPSRKKTAAADLFASATASAAARVTDAFDRDEPISSLSSLTPDQQRKYNPIMPADTMAPRPPTRQIEPPKVKIIIFVVSQALHLETSSLVSTPSSDLTRPLSTLSSNSNDPAMAMQQGQSLFSAPQPNTAASELSFLCRPESRAKSGWASRPAVNPSVDASAGGGRQISSRQHQRQRSSGSSQQHHIGRFDYSEEVTSGGGGGSCELVLDHDGNICVQ
jgi:hypothetical protein